MTLYRTGAAALFSRPSFPHPQVLDSKATDLGGVKQATAMISGPGAFGQLRWESGVHRATKVPDNDKHGRMQTGTAVVIVLPEASEVGKVLG